MEKVNLSSPWVTFYRELDALLGCDPEVKVNYDEEDNSIKVFVDNEEKAEALAELLPAEKTFGNVTVRVSVVPANRLGENKASLFQKAFEGNPALAFVKTEDKGLYSFGYVVFRKEVVQFFNDDLSDLNGNRSTLYQEIAKDVFGETDGIFFCTDEK